MEAPSVDIEILGLIYGLGNTAKASKISEDAIRKMIEKLNPENHTFFIFVRDCLLQLINKIGPEEASKKLEISVPALKTIAKHAKAPSKSQKFSFLKLNKTPKKGDIKKQVIEFYNNCKSLVKTAKRFNITREKAISYVISSVESTE